MSDGEESISEVRSPERIYGYVPFAVIFFSGACILTWLYLFAYKHYALSEEMFLPFSESHSTQEQLSEVAGTMYSLQLVFVLVAFIAGPLVTILAIVMAIVWAWKRRFITAGLLVAELLIGWLVVRPLIIERGREAELEFGKAIDYVAEQGDPIVEALSKYHDEHDVFPEEITELVPEYLEIVPVPGIVGSSQFDYSSSGDEYWLTAELMYSVLPITVIAYSSDGRHMPAPESSSSGWGWWVRK